jgi:hypothetical protein
VSAQSTFENYTGRNKQKWTVIHKKALQNINEIKVVGFSGESTFENYTSPLLKTTRQ